MFFMWGCRAQSRKEYQGANVREVWTFSYNDAEAINSCVVKVTMGMEPVVRFLWLFRLEVTEAFMDV